MKTPLGALPVLCDQSCKAVFARFSISKSIQCIRLFVLTSRKNGAMGGMYTDKRRLNPSMLMLAHYYSSGFPPPNDYRQKEVDFRGTQVTTSYRSRDRIVRDEKELLLSNLVPIRSGTDTGNPFSSTKQELRLSHKNFTIRAGNTDSYTGPLYPDYRFANVRAQWFSPLPRFEESYYGPAAIAATTPTSPVLSLSTFLGEFVKDGIPKFTNTLTNLASRKKPSLNQLGSDYLNLEFAWKPFISDLVSMLHVVANSYKLLEQLERDSGRVVRRRFEFPPEEPVTTVLSDKSGQIENVFNSSRWNRLVLSGGNRYVQERTTSKKVWFSGAYTYLLENNPDFLGRLKEYEQKANYLLGLKLTPEVLWNLAPWSWLADWNANIGINLQNYTQFSQDGLVLRYGYLMCTTTQTDVHTVYGVRTATGSPGPISVTATQTEKLRVKATPFGFGLKPGDFTARQWAILGALGMTKAPKTLW